jgi:hypothetical protein
MPDEPSNSPGVPSTEVSQVEATDSPSSPGSGESQVVVAAAALDEQPDAVEVMFEQLSRLVASLGLTGEPTLAVSVATIASKSLLLAAASRFESQLTDVVKSVAEANSSEAIASFCVNQGLVRKYHTLFDWDANNANKFFGLFGENLKQRAAGRKEADAVFADSIRDFIALGRLRNLLVHNDFVAFGLDDTLDELIERYRSARGFLPAVQTLLEE